MGEQRFKSIAGLQRVRGARMRRLLGRLGAARSHILLCAYIQCRNKVVVPQEVAGFGPRDTVDVVAGKPDHRRRGEELRCVEHPRHLLGVVGEREGREMWWRVWVRARSPLGGSEVIQVLGFYGIVFNVRISNVYCKE